MVKKKKKKRKVKKQSVSSSTWNFANLRVTSTQKIKIKMLGKKHVIFLHIFDDFS